MRRGWSALLVLGLACALPAPAPQAAPPPRQLCAAYAVSPDFARDRTMACATLESIPSPVPGQGPVQQVRIALSRDAGKTFRKVTATGLPPGATISAPSPGGPGPTVSAGAGGSHGLFFSNGYPKDAALYVAINQGALYRSTDGGESFRLVDVPSAVMDRNGFGIYTPLTLPQLLPLSDEDAYPVGVLYGIRSNISGETRNFSARLDPPTAHTPADGSPWYDTQFLTLPAPRNAVFTLAVDPDRLFRDDLPNPDNWQFGLFACDARLTCRDRKWVMAPGTFPHSLPAASSDLQIDSKIYWSDVRFESLEGRALTSRNDGRTFSTYSVAQAIGTRRNSRAWFDFSTTPSSPKRVLMRLHAFPRCPQDASGNACRQRWEDDPLRPDQEELWLSDDAGASYRKIAGGDVGRGRFLPWQKPGEAQGGTVRLAGGRLFYNAGREGRHAGWPDTVAPLWCSVDLGRTWSSPCSK